MTEKPFFLKSPETSGGMFQFGSPLSLTCAGKPTIVRKTRDISTLGIIISFSFFSPSLF